MDVVLGIASIPERVHSIIISIKHSFVNHPCLARPMVSLMPCRVGPLKIVYGVLLNFVMGLLVL